MCLKGQIWVSLRRAVSSLCPPGRMSFHCGFDTTVTSTHTHTHTHTHTLRQTDRLCECVLVNVPRGRSGSWSDARHGADYVDAAWAAGLNSRPALALPAVLD